MARLLPLFVYGTARLGQPLFRSIEAAVREEPSLVQAPGMELMVSKHGGKFPYMVPRRIKDGYNPSEHKVWGDLLLVERGKDLLRLVNMECAAGYTFEGIRITCAPEGLSEFALAFVYEREPTNLVPLGSPSWLTRHLSIAR